MWLNKLSFPLFFTILLIILIFVSVFIRIDGVGYSDLQGDEINTINYLYDDTSNFVDYLLIQKKGPVQFAINYVNTSIFGYVNEAQIRLPYLIAGILGLFALYKFVKSIDGRNSALLSVVIVATSGLFISFARIAQYQSVMFLMIFTFLYLFVASFKKQKETTLLVISAILFGIMVLNHYDALSILPFVLAYFFIQVRKHSKNLFPDIKKASLFFVIVLSIALAFYIPFLFNSEFSNSTSGYLGSRLLGGGFMPRTEITIKLLTMYIPKIWLYILFFASLLGIFTEHYKDIQSFKLFKFTIDRKAILYFFGFLIVVLGFAVVFSLFPIKPRTSSFLYILSALGISSILLLASKNSSAKIALTVWYVMAFSFYLFFVRDPRTHVYMAFLPGFIHAAMFFGLLATSRNAFIKYISAALLALAFIAVTLFNWTIYIDKSPEYPWWNKTLFGYPLYKIAQSNRIDGVFGFNSDRHWAEVGDLYKRGCLIGTYESNEKDNITTFYLGIPQLMGDKWSRENGADTMILLDGPQSWTYDSRREFGGYSLLKTYENDGVPVTFIYGKKDKYPNGSLLCN